MSKIISITNQKGGVGKTTTAINLAACIAMRGYRVLLIDSDPQGNATSGVGINRNKLKNCIYNLLIDQVKAEEIICSTRVQNLDILPATIQLAGAEVELAVRGNREYCLKKAIETVKNQYDYIFIDCPPSLGNADCKCTNSQSIGNHTLAV